MLYDLSNSYQAAEFRDKVKQVLEQGWVVELKRKFPKRTLPQNNLLHLWLGYFASEYGCSLDEAKVEYYKKLCNKDIFEVEVTNKRGQTVKVLRSSADLTTEEMSKSMDRFRNWAMMGGIPLPQPEDKEFILHCQREIERYKSYV